MKNKKKLLLDIDKYLNLDKKALELNLDNLLKKLEKDSTRMKKIIKQSDKQQLEILKLYDTLDISNRKLEVLHTYDVEQQQIASAKVKSNIVNELYDDKSLDVETIFIPSDILSGDFYSLFKKPNGSIIFYVVDGQGHGISPSLTVFAVSSIIARYVKENISLQEFMDKIVPYLRNFLIDEEQLSYAIVEIDADFKNLSYSSGGMYPMLLKDNNEIIKLKANALPILNFSEKQDVKTVELKNFQSIAIYSDGLVELEDESLLEFAPRKLIDGESDYSKARKMIPTFKRNDDVTLISITKS